MTRRSPSPLEPVIDAVESASALDGPARAVAGQLRALIPPGPLKDALSGSWLGHALHPMLTDVVIGSLTSATLLDLLGGDTDGRASRRLIAIGIAAYPPTALTGGNDWADAEPADDGVRRAGLVHAASNAAALALYAASLSARRSGRGARGKLLGFGGAAALAAGGYLGGHLAYRKGVRVEPSHTG
jgi:uncharacterized membrane protein